MRLLPLTDSKEIQNAFNILIETLKRGSQPFHRSIGWQGGSKEGDVYWKPDEGFWTTHESSLTHLRRNRHILLLGDDNPTEKKMMNIVCEINSPSEGINRRCAGFFVKDDEEIIYLAHSGKIGGGRKGIGKSAFRSFYRGAWETITWPDKKNGDVAIVIGPIDGERLVAQVANFVREVRRFKDAATDSNDSSQSTPKLNQPSEPQFNPEFSGRRRDYQVRSTIKARCDHGLVISTLANELEARGIKVANDRNRDLYILNGSNIDYLFEAKTELSTSSVYQGIGQLLYHSIKDSPIPKRVFVLPEKPNSETEDILKRLDVRVLVYEWQKNKPVFSNLSNVLGLS